MKQYQSKRPTRSQLIPGQRTAPAPGTQARTQDLTAAPPAERIASGLVARPSPAPSVAAQQSTPASRRGSSAERDAITVATPPGPPETEERDAITAATLPGPPEAGTRMPGAWPEDDRDAITAATPPAQSETEDHAPAEEPAAVTEAAPPARPPRPAPDKHMRSISYAAAGVLNLITGPAWIALEHVPELQPAAQALASSMRYLFGSIGDWAQGNKLRAAGQFTSAVSQMGVAGSGVAALVYPDSPHPYVARAVSQAVYSVGQYGVAHPDVQKGVGVARQGRGAGYLTSSVTSAVAVAGYSVDAAVHSGVLGDDPQLAKAVAMVLEQFGNFNMALTQAGAAWFAYVNGRAKGQPWNPKATGRIATALSYLGVGAATTLLQVLRKHASHPGMAVPDNHRELLKLAEGLGAASALGASIGEGITSYGEINRRPPAPTGAPPPGPDLEAGHELSERSHATSRASTPPPPASSSAASVHTAGTTEEEASAEQAYQLAAEFRWLAEAIE